MSPTSWVWPVLFGTCLAYRIPRLVKAVRRAKRSGSGQRFTRPIFWVMTSGFLIYMAACVQESVLREKSFVHWVTFLGLSLYAMALGLREKAMTDLGRQFSPHIEIRNQHRLIREGLYRYIRHPLLACMGLEVIGVGLMFQAYACLVMGGLGLYFPLIVIRQRLEERQLCRSLGLDYQLYRKEVGAFWPRFPRIRHG